MKTFSMNEMENIFEVGRLIQLMIDRGTIEVLDSKDAFLYALQCAIEFDTQYPDTEEYYSDIEVFAVDKIQERFGLEN